MRTANVILPVYWANGLISKDWSSGIDLSDGIAWAERNPVEYAGMLYCSEKIYIGTFDGRVTHLTEYTYAY